MTELVNTLLEWTATLDHWGVFILMTIESSFIPFPSEIVVPPAAYLASKGEMNLMMIIIAGICGSLTGAGINYFLADFLGRPLIYALAEKKFARFLLISPEKIEKSEKYFNKYGNTATFLGRLVPGIRQLISIPAGLSRMHLAPFFFYTALGSGIWVTILAILGYLLGEKEELIAQYISGFSIVFVAIALVAGYLVYKKIKKRRKN